MSNETITEGLIKLFKEQANNHRKALKSHDIIAGLKAFGIVIKANKLRALIGDLRKQDALNPYFILSSVDDGYWLSDNTGEMDEYLERQLYRISHQYDNIQSLHQRRRQGKVKTSGHQQMMFAL